MNIDEMPAGPELDRLIAEKVMGWWLQLNGNNEPIAWCRDKGEIVHGMFEPWQPSTNIAHALEVIDYLRAHYELESNCHTRIRSPFHTVEVYEVGTKTGRYALQSDQSLPLAICRAALLAVGAK